jgi:hypothetical protein
MLELTRLGGKENQGSVIVLFATSFEHGMEINVQHQTSSMFIQLEH